MHLRSGSTYTEPAYSATQRQRRNNNNNNSSINSNVRASSWPPLPLRTKYNDHENHATSSSSNYIFIRPFTHFSTRDDSSPSDTSLSRSPASTSSISPVLSIAETFLAARENEAVPGDTSTSQDGPHASKQGNMGVKFLLVILFVALMSFITGAWVFKTAPAFRARTNVPAEPATSSSFVTQPSAAPTTPEAPVIPAWYMNIFKFEPAYPRSCLDILSGPDGRVSDLKLSDYRRQYRLLVTAYHPDKAKHLGIDAAVAKKASVVLNYCWQYVQVQVGPRDKAWFAAANAMEEASQSLEGDGWMDYKQLKEKLNMVDVDEEGCRCDGAGGIYGGW